MPSSEGYIRDYKQEYSTSQSSLSEIKRRSSRNKARRKMKKQGRVRLGDGMDVDHKNTNPMNNGNGNLRVQKKGINRSFKRNKNGGKK